jgi:23S rRNA U2552 (ribose-2'-O)-methylase RlmE/FtsJ
MMTRIGKVIQATQKILQAPYKTKNMKALDICMAPGGFSATVLNHNRDAKVCALSLPRDEGGRDVLHPDWKTDKRVEI